MNLREALRRSPAYRPYVRLKYQLSSKAREDLFTGFYRDNVWGDPDSASGSGSTLAETHALRQRLPLVLTDLEVKTLLDVPCGDFFWMQHVDLGSIRYIGGDVVRELVHHNERSFGSPTRRFIRVDVVSDPLPTVTAIMVRDLFLHLPLPMVHKAVANIKKCGATWLLASDYPESGSNPDVELGQHRFLNLALPPFGWPQPRTTIQDGAGERPDKRLGVWRIADLP